MRTIKFRGKRIDDGEWIYGYLADVQEQYGYATIDYVFDDGEEYWESCDHVDVNTVGQFTGLHDKNGKEIYEGDIVKLWFPLSDEKDADLNEVRWNDKLGRYELVFICPFNGKENYLLFCDIANITVIGNIHDNFEIQEGGEK